MKNDLIKVYILIFAIIVGNSMAANLPVNPYADQKTKDMLSYFYEISGKNILSGQETDGHSASTTGFSTIRDDYVYSVVGKYPAVFSSDYSDFGTTNLSERSDLIQTMIEYARNGSVITLSNHMIQPDLPDGSGFDAMNIKGSTYDKVDEILTEGSELNLEHIKRIDDIAANLKVLQDSGVVVLWRPFHEMNGDWFWWSYQDRYTELWVQMWERLVEYHKLTNILFVWSANYWSDGATGKANPETYYPGDKYVDILGVDVYPGYGHSYSQHLHDELLRIGNNRPITFTENGQMPDVTALAATQPNWLYWLTWFGFEAEDHGNTDALYASNYSNPRTVTQDEVGTLIAEDTTKATLSISTIGNGTISQSVEGNYFDKGAVITLTATPGEGNSFTGWSGTISSTENPLTITLNENTLIKATFLMESGANLILNGDFDDGTNDWANLGVYEGAVADFTVTSGVAEINITTSSTESWHVQFSQNDLNLVDSAIYKLTFDGMATSARDVSVKIGENGGDYASYLGSNFGFTTSMQTFEKEFTMKGDNPAARIEFNIGDNDGTLSLDNISLVQIGGSTPVLLNTKNLSLQTSFHSITSINGLINLSVNRTVDLNKIKVYNLNGKSIDFSATQKDDVLQIKLTSTISGVYMVNTLY